MKDFDKLRNREVGQRLKEIRAYYKVNQQYFAEKINIAQSTLAAFEMGDRTLRDIHVAAIATKFNVNPTWLKTGVGNMLNDTKDYSLDEYAEMHNLSALEFDIIKTYMEIDEGLRRELLEKFSDLFFNHKVLDEIEKQQVEQIVSGKDIDLSSGVDILIKDKNSTYIVEVKDYMQDAGRISREK